MDKEQVPSRAMVTKLLKVNGYAAKFDHLMRNYPILVAAPYVDKERAKEVVEKLQRPDDLMKQFQQIYTNHLTADDILNLIAFYKTTAGQKLVEHDEKIRMEMGEAALKIAVEIAVDLVREMTPKPPPKNDIEFPDEFPDSVDF